MVLYGLDIVIRVSFKMYGLLEVVVVGFWTHPDLLSHSFSSLYVLSNCKKVNKPKMNYAFKINLDVIILIFL